LLKIFEEGYKRNEPDSKHLDICISLNDKFYTQTILKSAKRVHTGESSLSDETNELIRYLKSLGGRWLKQKRNKKQTQVDDKVALKSKALLMSTLYISGFYPQIISQLPFAFLHLLQKSVMICTAL